MTAENKVPSLANMNTKQKATAGIIVVIVLVVIWQIVGLFGGSKAPSNTAAIKPMASAKPGASASAMPIEVTTKPKPAEIPMAQPLTALEAQLMQLQQETQARYMQALNELQMLKLQRDIALTNKDISSAKLATVQSERKIVDLLAPPPPPPIAETLTTKQVTSASQMDVGDQNVKYSVVSVSQLQYKWAAVINYKGSLYNVHVGDVLPPDGSSVEAINSDGVMLSKEGIKSKLSLVPAI